MSKGMQTRWAGQSRLRMPYRLSKILPFCLTALITFLVPAWALDYPTKPIRMIVPVTPGGASDVLARLIGPKLTESMGQQVVIDYRPGGASIIGTELAAKSAPDGYTLLVISSGHTVVPSLKLKVPYDTVKDFSAVIRIGASPLILTLHPSIPANSVKELIALAKSQPGLLTFGSSGIGASSHLTGELFKSMTGVQMLHVPFKGAGQATTDLLGGHISMSFSNPFSIIPHIQSGKLKALAVTSSFRLSAFPDIPTVAESGVPGFETFGWWGILAPAKTPRDIIRKLHAEIAKALHSPNVEPILTKQGIIFRPESPEEFDAFIKADVSRWARVLKAAGIKPN